ASRSAAAVNSLASSVAASSTSTPNQRVRIAWGTVRGGRTGAVGDGSAACWTLCWRLCSTCCRKRRSRLRCACLALAALAALSREGLARLDAASAALLAPPAAEVCDGGGPAASLLGASPGTGPPGGVAVVRGPEGGGVAGAGGVSTSASPPPLRNSSRISGHSPVALLTKTPAISLMIAR